MDHAGYGGFAAVLDVGGGSGDGTGGGDAAEEGGGHVAQTLGYKLGVGTVLLADHAVGHNAAEKRLNGCQYCDGEGVGQSDADLVKAEAGETEAGQIAADSVEVADGVDAQRQELDHQDAHHYCDEGCGDLGQQLGHEDQHRKADRAHDEGVGVEAAEACNKCFQLFHGLNGGHALGVSDTEEVLQLADNDGHGDTGGKAGGDGQRDELNERAQTADTQNDEDDAGQHGGDHKALHAAFRHDTGHDGGKGSGGTGDLHMAAAEKGDDKACDDGGVDTLLRAHAGGQGQGNGQGQGDYGDDDTGYHVGNQLLLVVALHGIKNDGFKVFHLYISPEISDIFEISRSYYSLEEGVCKEIFSLLVSLFQLTKMAH